MISTEPTINPTSLFEAKAAAEILGIDRTTLHRWTKKGYIKAGLRMNNRMAWRGSELIKAWRANY